MNRLGIFYLIILLFTQSVSARVEMSGQFSTFRQIGMDLHCSFIEEGEDIPSDPREWPMVQRHLSQPGYSARSVLNFMRVMNNLVLVPEYPVIPDFSGSGDMAKHNGSRLIAISRKSHNEMERLDKSRGRYVIFQTNDPPSVWTTWIKESDAQIILRNIDDFDPAKAPLLFPEAGSMKQPGDYLSLWLSGGAIAVAILIWMLIPDRSKG